MVHRELDAEGDAGVTYKLFAIFTTYFPAKAKMVWMTTLLLEHPFPKEGRCFDLIIEADQIVLYFGVVVKPKQTIL
jgi:hypothetical protein